MNVCKYHSSGTTGSQFPPIETTTRFTLPCNKQTNNEQSCHDDGRNNHPYKIKRINQTL